MPSLLSNYESSSRADKGKILDEITNLTKRKYPTVRRKILEESFSYGDQKLIAEFYNNSIEELFPKSN